jgi:hypothetical protein
MYIKQLSVFIENREGRLEEVLQALKLKNVNIVSLSLADTSDYGLLRLLVTNPEDGYEALKESGFSARLSNVLAIKISHQVGKLQELLEAICDAHINIEYMYALSTGQADASIVIKTSDPDKAVATLQAKGVEIITEDEIRAM